MKKFLLMATALMMAASCCQKAPKVLVLYYSQTGVTKTVAEELQTRLGADIEAVQAVVPYDGDFMATIERSRQEMESGAFPDIEPLKVDVRDYDVIFLGFPVWFGTYATPIATLLNTTDFSGKKIVPFCTFGSGGLESSVKALTERLADSEILPGYGVRAARIEAVPAELDRFLKEGGYVEGECEPLPEFPEQKPVTEEEAAIFNAAVGDYPMMHAQAETVASREVPGGVEYCFTARDLPREGGLKGPGGAMPERTMTVYVLVEQEKAPVFTRVNR